MRGDEKTKAKSIAKNIVIKTHNRKTKFKLRCPRYVYTLKIDDEKKAEKIKNSMPQGNFIYLLNTFTLYRSHKERNKRQKNKRRKETKSKEINWFNQYQKNKKVIV